MYNISTIQVIYLSWIPYGIEEIQGFLDSYLQYDAGAVHQLFIVFNGVQQGEEHLPFLQYAQNRLGYPVKYMLLQSGQDIEAYYKAARELDSEYLLFLNTFSRILANDWLKKYTTVFLEHANTGLVSASGSYLSYTSAVFIKNKWGWEPGKGIHHHFTKYKLFAKSFFYWRLFFKSFPNPHIRTNAFMLKKHHLLSIHPGVLTTKFKAYQFESGRKGLTAFFLKKQMDIFVLGKNGMAYPVSQWPNSNTFWIHNQENLLISDNQTRIYDQATEANKKMLTKLAWGQ